MFSYRILDQIINLSLKVLALFMVGEAIYHVSGIRLAGVETYWPESAVIFARLFLALWASASLISGVFLWQWGGEAKKDKRTLLLVAMLALLHSGILYYFSFFNLEKILPVDNLYVWNPYYSWQLRVEALALDLLAVLLLAKRGQVKGSD